MRLISEILNREVGCFFNFEEKVVACVSGGADSIALLNSLINCGKNLQIVVAHFNHMLRGNESVDDELFVKNFCKQKRLKFVSKSVDVAQTAKLKKISVELAGRIERYKFFNEVGFGRTIVTAHTLSDRVETLLFNLARGASLKGLCSIPSRNCNIKRPLLCFSRSEIEDYCEENGLLFRTDSSNFDLAYSRNRIRHRIVPEFKVLNKKFEYCVFNTIRCLQNDNSYFLKIVDKFLKKWFVAGKLNVSNLRFEHWSIKSRVVVEFLKFHEIEPSFELVERILNLIITKSYFKISVVGSKSVCFTKEFLSVEIAKKLGFEKFGLVLPNFVEFSYKNLLFIKIKIRRFDYFLRNTPHLFLFKFDYDKIKGLICIRSRMAGDRIKLPGRPTKKLKSLMQEAKVSTEKRNAVVVLADDLGPFWVCGFGGDVRVLADEGTENLILIFKKKDMDLI